MSKIALVQHAPVFLDGAATITKAVDLIHQAAAQQAKLIIFPEAFLPGYPAWIWRLRPGGDWGLCETLHQRLLQNAVTLSGPEVQVLSEAAKQAQVTLVCGINERDEQTSGTTLYNSVLTFAEDGSILNHHRKLMPTNPERMTWGMGDGRGLQVVQTAQGRIGSLICWENYMPLARYALYAEIDIAQVASARRTLDVAGHYARPDVLSLQLNRQPQNSLKIVP